MDKLRQALLWLNANNDQQETTDKARTLTALGAKLLRSPKTALDKLTGFIDTANFHETETNTWVPAVSLKDSENVPFDVCDIRHWIEIAKMANVPAVEAREILHLSENEMSHLSGNVKLPESKTLNSLFSPALNNDTENLELPDGLKFLKSKPINEDEVYEKLYAAMDNIPEGWMVRFSRSGGSELKILAGAGVVGDKTPEIRFSNDLEVGPGWVRNGNRRRVNVSDMRTIKAAAEGPSNEMTFLARPWVKASRYFVTEDIHRANTPFEGKGVWPAEWRAFVEDGKVTGVSYYYSWTGEVNPENAAIALEVRENAQRMIDVTMNKGFWPRYMDIEHIRNSKNASLVNDEGFQDAMKKFGRETVSCTLDFIETENGLMLLEGGPGASPVGGGHPCGFAGCGGKPTMGNRPDTNGVAFRNMSHVIVGDPSTWEDGDRTDAILSWDEVVELASSNTFKP